MKNLGIIGFGNFGKLAAKSLKPYFNVCVYDKSISLDDVKKIGVKNERLEEVASKEIVVLAVPVDVLEGVIIQIKDIVKENSLILDVSSVKVKPVSLMKKHFPESVELIGTHPLFGPESGKHGLEGLNITLCPIRTKSLDCLKTFLTDKYNLNIFEKTPEEHDKEMAYVQVLTHYIAQALHQIDIPKPHQSTKAYEDIYHMKEYLKNDSKALFMTLQKQNPFAQQIRNEFVDKLREIEQGIIDY